MKTPSQSRRTVLQNASFVVPTILALKLTEIKAKASSGNLAGNNDVNNGKQNENNNFSHGNHYGNNTPDMNSRDKKNKHNGINNIHNH